MKKTRGRKTHATVPLILLWKNEMFIHTQKSYKTDKVQMSSIVHLRLVKHSYGLVPYGMVKPLKNIQNI